MDCCVTTTTTCYNQVHSLIMGTYKFMIAKKRGFLYDIFNYDSEMNA